MAEVVRVGLKKTFRFEAAHSLPNYHGKCARKHGHSYRLEVSVSRAFSEMAPSGVVLDFDVLKGAVQDTVVNKLDHQDLNNFFETPTAEVMARWAHNEIQAWFKMSAFPDVEVTKVVLWETETCCAEFPV